MAQKALGPPPTTVGQDPHPSVTVSSTVAAWPLVTRCTLSWIDGGWLGNGTSCGAALTVIIGTVTKSTVALVRRATWSACSWLLPPAQPASRAVSAACKLPAVGATCTPTSG